MKQAPVEDHDYEVEIPEGADLVNGVTGEFRAIVQLLRCKDCGHLSVGWQHDKRRMN